MCELLLLCKRVISFFLSFHCIQDAFSVEIIEHWFFYFYFFAFANGFVKRIITTTYVPAKTSKKRMRTGSLANPLPKKNSKSVNDHC